ncbi:MAG TPA: glucosyl-3-phosphoglycerate synthase [Chloroflexi bacterium]|nr:glucosyl-3-phosphoglycerate synthase [Chloroflexota bacterium]
MWPELPFKLDPHVRVSYDPLGDLVTLIEEHNCDTVLLRLANNGRHALGLPVEGVLSRLVCRVVLQRGDLPPDPERILLSSRGDEHGAHAAVIAAALGHTLGCDVTLLRPALTRGNRLLPWQSEGGDSDDEPEWLRKATFTREISIRGSLVDLIEALQRELKRHQILVIGTTARESLRGALSSRTYAILDAVTRPTILVHAPVEYREPALHHRPLPLPLSVDKWFAENTFDADEFSDIGRLVALKEAQGLTISLGLPALNEEDTVGNVITTVRSALMDEYPLLDEIVLIDSNSTDATVEIAESLGIPVYRHSEILPDQGSYAGKGEALWKSLYILRGDIIAWIDTDIVNIHPRFVYGLVGPLLVSPRVMYVKGFYRRPLRVGDKLQAGGGGRVTELVARPLLNLFFPDLSGIVQPLSGEYAGRRSVLERVPFFSGYAVETGLLIDILSQYGLSAIAQVDLKERIHHNQPLTALSKMSFAIIQAFLERLEDHAIIQMLVEPSHSMKLISDDEGRLFLDIEELYDVERPPMATVPAYRARRAELEQAPASDEVVTTPQSEGDEH